MLTLLIISIKELFTVLIAILILIAIVIGVKWLLDQFPNIPAPLKAIIYIVLFVIVLVVTLGYFGIW